MQPGPKTSKAEPAADEPPIEQPETDEESVENIEEEGEPFNGNFA